MTRRSIFWTGLTGLAGAMLLTAASLFVMIQGLIPAVLQRPLFVWGLFLFLLTFSVLEIPLMIFAMRRMAASPNPRARTVVLLTIAGYTFFAAVYALPFILLTGNSSTQLTAGLLLASLSLVRFISAMVFLPNDKQS